jgi:SP family sugar:H+ symporter-like MFS transporter
LVLPQISLVGSVFAFSRMTSTIPPKPIGYLLFLSIAATLAGFLFGFDASVVNGTVLALAAAFGTSAAATGFAVAVVLLGSAVGAFAAGQLSDHFGRRRVMMVTAVLFGVSAWGAGAAGSASVFVVFRLIGGLGVGAACVVAPAYIAEISPAHLRGRLTTLQQLAIVGGLQSAFLSNWLIARAAGGAEHLWLLHAPAWRWMFWVQLVPSAVYLLATLFLPESPRYLVMRGREAEARLVMARLWGALADLDGLVADIRDSVGREMKMRFSDVLVPGTKRLLPIVAVGCALAFFSQASGINVVMYFGELLWHQAGFSEQNALLINVTIGANLILATLVSMALVDRVGRRPLLLTGGAIMTAMLAALMVIFFLSERRADGMLAPTHAQAVIALTAEHLYIFCFGASWGPVTWVLLGEMFPNRMRGSALAVAAAALWTANFVVTFTFPRLMEAVGLGGAFAVYAGFALLSVGFVHRLVPETRGRTLEQMGESAAAAL